MRRRSNRTRRGASMAQKLFTASLVVLFLMVAGMAALFVFDQVRQFIAASDVLPDFTIKTTPEPSEVVYEPGEPLPRWDGTERINILTMGIDQRELEQGPWRTDTMLILTLDPVTLSGGMLSIPRDLWVPIPGFEEGRINTAHYIGDLRDYPGGGTALAAKTVQYNIGVPIHHYVRVNFAAFEQLIDFIGGIDVYVEEEISDPAYPDEAYGYDPLHIAAGLQHFDGETALKYARTRHSPGGDFDRAKRQQQVLLAVFEQSRRLELLPQLAPRAPEIWSALQDAVVTDLSLGDIISLARLASEVEPANVRYGVVDERYTEFWTTLDGQEVLIPLREQIRELRDSIFTAVIPTSQAEAEQTEEPAETPTAEAASIEILNGTTTVGLASLAAEHLQRNDLQVERVDNADRADYADSLVISYTGKTRIAEHIIQLLALPPTSLVLGADPAAEYDISVILGGDFQPPDQQTAQ